MSRRKPKPQRREAVIADGSTTLMESGPKLTDSPLWPWLLLIIVVVSAVFARTHTFEFTSWDDVDNVTSNLMLERGWAGLRDIWSAPYRNLYIPLVYSSYLVDMAIGGGSPRIFHLHNIAYQVLAAVGVFVLLRVLGLRLNRPYTPFACAAGALIFAVHPLQAEPVSWVTGRKDVMSGALGIWSLLAFQAAMLRVTQFDVPLPVALRNSHVIRLLAASIVLLILALLAKPGAVAIPLIAAAIELAIPFAITASTSVLHRLAVTVPLFVVAAICVVVTSTAQTLPPGLSEMVPLSKRPIAMIATYAWYAKSTVWPIGLSPVYGLLTWELLTHWLAYVGGGLAIASAAIMFLTRRSVYTVAILIFAAALLPTSGITPYLYQIYSAFADRYAYFALLAPALLLAHSLSMVESTARLYVAQALSVVLIVGLSVLTVRQTEIWRNSELLWTRAIENAPNLAEANNNYGYAIAVKNQSVKARPYFEKAVALKPGYADAWINLGLSQSNAGESDAAIRSYRTAVSHKPNASAAYSNLMAEFINVKRPADAVTAGQAAIAANAGASEVYLNLAIAHLRLGQIDQARRIAQSMLAQRPNYAPARQLLQQIENPQRRP